ncbi:MAG: hypothetical protein LBD89_02930 [Tannerellaceae bacterium]|nr:hypothetical protein [Tannerellaceae bacterium]
MLVLFCIIPQSGAREIYVSPSGAGSGDGATTATAINYTRLITILGTNGELGDATINVHFAGGTYNVTASLNSQLSHARYNGKTLNFIGEGTDTNPAILDGGGSVYQLLNLELGRNSTSNLFTFTVNNMILQNFSGNYSSGAKNSSFIAVDNHNTVKLDKVTVRNCNNTGGSDAHLFLLFADAYTTLEISNSSIINNNRGGANLIRHYYSGTFLFYNNTVSDNTCDNAISHDGAITDFNDQIFNNTFYNTGNIDLTSSSSSNVTARFVNNIVFNSSGTVTISNSSATKCIRNIVNGAFHASNYSGSGTATTFNNDFYPNLTRHSAPGAQYYRIRNAGASNHSIFGRGGDRASLPSETGTTVSLVTDQIARERPATGLALGSIDVNHIFTKDTTIIMIKQPGVTLQTQTIDLSHCVEAPAAMGTLSFELLEQMLPIGTLEGLSGSQTTFRLATGISSGTYTFAYKVTSGNNGTISDIGYVTLSIGTTTGIPPGYTDPGDFSTCFAYMGKVDFTADYRFRSQLVSGNGSSSGDRMYGFSIPLVGDLNGDGYPEIIGISTSGSGSLHGHYNGIHIYNGQTGKRINKLYFPGVSSGDYYYHSGFHGAPSIMALVDSDRDGTVEVIVAFPHSESGTDSRYRSKVASFELVYDNGAKTYSLREKWSSASTYNDGETSYDKPMPQVVDLDGDGTPEVVVYNKIYNAVTGDLLMKLETITTAHIGRNTVYQYSEDRYVGSPYVYDMDGDGIYDVVAGGRIYKIRKDNGGTLPGESNSGFSADKIEMSGVLDGFTGVADINGDGKADVVVFRRESSSKVSIYVWTPRFDSNGTYSPTMIASRDIKIENNLSNGNSSYVYIGDIDGREQEYGGNTYRLPEIAVLTGRVDISQSTLPRHPNIVNIPAGDAVNQGGFPTSMPSSTGGLLALTFDPSDNTLKSSFVLEHEDTSINTGFTMFDFDNDGIQELCYRDMQTLRIIKPTIPYVKNSYTDTHVSGAIKFKKVVKSYTGFEYPVIADIDNDASAEMVVMGHEDSSLDPHGYIYAVGNGTGDKFAPALPVWNQFMYDPFKINPNLTTPVGPAVNRLSTEFTFRREIKDENNEVIKTIARYQPFNGTLIQAPYYMGIETTVGELPDFEPIVFLTEAYIRDNNDSDPDKRPKITGSSSPYYIEITIGNRSTAKADIPPSIPIALYGNNRVSQAMHKGTSTLSALEYWDGSAWTTVGTTSISVGKEMRVRISITDPDDIYIIRLGDNSGLNTGNPAVWEWRWGLNDLTGDSPNPALGIGVASRQFRDCQWDDQVVVAARNQVIDDTQTVQEFHSVVIDIWENDILPDTYFTNLTIHGSDSMQIIHYPKAGALSFSGTGRESRITYHHNDSVTLTQAIDSFKYYVKFWDVTRSPAAFKEQTATVYIYVIESATHGFAACYGETTTLKLANKPIGVLFDWYKAEGDTAIYRGSQRTISLEADSVYRIHPTMPAGGAFEHLDFPKGRLTVSLVTSSSEHAVMRWTGQVSHNWKDPNNWVEVKNNYETPVAWAPTGCVDVVIPSGATNYPELKDSARCGNITMKDRAMLKNPHVLTYDKAAVEFKPTPMEKDSFIMWSAPLQDMYSGDYHFKNSNAPTPNWGDSYMMFFQMKNPDNTGIIPVANTMTSSVGHPGVLLPLGVAFNFRLSATTVNRDSVLRFPKSETSYTGANQTVYPQLNRAKSHRFITDSVTLNNDLFDLTVPNNVTGARYVQVVNPYFAWLSVSKFLSGNFDKLNPTNYISWDGNLNTGFVSFHASETNDTLRYWIPSFQALTATSSTAEWIAPLKSFFVQTQTATPASLTLKMSPVWTTTTGPSNPYTLRASTPQTPPLLYIRASQGEKSGSAVLHFNPGSLADYNEPEDVVQLFYDGTNGSDGIPLTVYTLTPRGVALSVNTSGDFASAKTALGLRVRDPGEVRLDFTGLSTFLHHVYLTDEELKKEIDLQKTPTYTFTVSKQADGKAIYLNDRFNLRIDYTGVGVSQLTSLPDYILSGDHQRIDLQSPVYPIRRLQIYNLIGALVYASNTPSQHFSIPMEAGLYVVKFQLKDEEKTEKLRVK